MDDATSYGSKLDLLSSDEESFKVVPFSSLHEEWGVKLPSLTVLGTATVESVLTRGGSIASLKQIDEIRRMLEKHFGVQVTSPKVDRWYYEVGDACRCPCFYIGRLLGGFDDHWWWWMNPCFLLTLLILSGWRSRCYL